MSIKENTLKEFDFEKVAKVMNMVGWKYWDTPLGEDITVDKLKEVASERIDRIIDHPENIFSESGGFKAEWESIGDEGKVIRLEFILETAYGYEDNEYA